ncbi:WD40 repeat-like protein [Auricularia subglabra TFB-10046 SS5]|nr:WD40 repeat-like protein [Auricularia subglabra TFB-10046 SS5]
MRIADGQLPQQRIFNAHENYIRDLRWSRDDQLIASASSDHTAKITSVTTSQCVRMIGPQYVDAPVNFVSWDPNNDSLLCTVGRDRQIRIWDLRDNGGAPTLVIAPDLPTTSSITSTIYLPHEPHSLVTSWNTDGILKKWDFRTLSSPKRDASKSVTKPAEESSHDPTRTGSQRARGISSLLYNARTCNILGLAVDGRIHTYHPFLTAGPDASSSVTFGYGSARNSFYVRLCESPCGRWIASGSTAGKTHVYDVATPARAGPGGFVRGVELGGHTDEVHGIDWAMDGLAVASDDATVNIWRHDIDVAQKCRADPEAQKWNWHWATRAGSV